MKNYSHISYRYLENSKKRSILTCIGIILSVALICAIGTLIVSYRENDMEQTKKDKGEFHVVFEGVSENKVRKIEGHLDSERVGVLREIGKSKIYEANPGDINVKDMPMYKYIDIVSYDKKAMEMLPLSLKEGNLPKNENEITIEEWALEYIPNHPKVGDKITLPLGEFTRKTIEHSKKYDEEECITEENFGDGSNYKYDEMEKKTFVLSGILDSRFYSQYNIRAKAITSPTLDITSKGKCNAYVYVNKKKNIEKYIDEVKLDMILSGNKENMKVDFNYDLLNFEGRGIDKEYNTTVFLIVALIIFIIVMSTIMVIYNIFQMSVMDRIRQFGILSSIGATPKQIRKIVYKEAGVLGFISIPIGLLSGVAAMNIVFYIIKKILSGNIDFEFKVVASPYVFIISIVIALITIYISCVKPAFIASKISPLDAIKSNFGIKTEKVRKVKTNILMEKIFKIEGNIAYKNIKKNKRRFLVTISSTIVSIVLFIAFSFMMSMGSTMDSVKKQSYRDYELRKVPESNKNSGFSQKDYITIKNIRGVENVYRIFESRDYVISVHKELITPEYRKILNERNPQTSKEKNENIPLLLKGYGREELKLCKNKLLKGNVSEEELKNQKGVLLVQNGSVFNTKSDKASVINFTNFKVGDKIQICKTSSEGKEITKGSFKVLGILRETPIGDAKSDNGEIYAVTTEELFKDMTKDKTFYSMHILVDGKAERKNITAQLKKFADTSKKIILADTKEKLENIKKESIIQGIFLYGFVAVITIIGSLNIINTIETNLILRKRELAAMQAIGMSSKQVNKMIYLEGGIYGIISSTFGGVIGTTLTYVIYRIFSRVREVKWSVPWKYIIIAAIGAIIISLLSAYFPLRKIKKESIVDNIRMEE